MIKVTVADRQTAMKVAPARLRVIVHAVLKGEGITKASISLALVTDELIHRLNRRFLKHDSPTDVLTFPLAKPSEGPLLGEIVISTDTAVKLAGEYGHAAASEVALYLVHGLLHLCGYDDQEEAERQRMRRRERHYLRQLKVRLKGRVDGGKKRKKG